MQQFLNIITSQSIYGAVFATLVFVGIGFACSKIGLISSEMNMKLSLTTINYFLPVLCFGAFMKNAEFSNISTILKVLITAFGFYILFAIYAKLVINYWPKLISNRIQKKAILAWEKANKPGEYSAYKQAYIRSYQERLLAIEMIIAYGSLQYFAFPLIKSLSETGVGQSPIFEEFAIALLQIWNIPFLIGVSTHMRMTYAGIKVNRKELKSLGKALLHPMLITLYISLICYLLQFAFRTQFIDPNATLDKSLNISNYGYYQYVYNPEIHKSIPQEYLHHFWAAFPKQLPMFGMTIAMGVSIVSPIAWINIGASLHRSNVKSGIKSLSVWMSVIRKLIIAPLVMLFVISIPMVYTKFINVSTGVLFVLLMACPPATACVTYSLASNHKEIDYTAQVSSLATLCCLFTIPLWVVGSFCILTIL
ncbi:hypothetical protein KQ874_02190 [Mycoplasma sp. ES3157-GEN-MYC]|uniref:hypothetical protein n=1 Tax=Mycoplasma miroungigenitalium TaxID=754515 RepID=UPI001C12730B|nr:hypothetical protein [Mycoplasma miroungigenitalium]MBU4690497.1 hypothetical protein [Mycoplasma miroungigenitalium]MBU4691764.1 hypothetical protein [Mycoplasma miroungigenitalium]